VIRFFLLDELATGVVFMSDECSKTKEVRYIIAAALLVGALLWDVAAMMVRFRPIGLLCISAALVWNGACAITAWFSWRRSSRFFDLSINPGIGRREPPRIQRAV
jgi:predicted membrane metal-binding protein